MIEIKELPEKKEFVKSFMSELNTGNDDAINHAIEKDNLSVKNLVNNIVVGNSGRRFLHTTVVFEKK